MKTITSLLCAFFALAASLRTVVVDKEQGKGDYASLTDAIKSGEHDILINDGVYEIEETIQINKISNVRIRGKSKSNTILRYSGMNSFLLVSDTHNISVSDLTLVCESPFCLL